MVKLAQDVVCSSSGGNCSVEPLDARTRSYFDYVREKRGNGAFVTAEALLSGDSLVLMYQFLAKEQGIAKIEDIGNYEIIRRATEDQDPVSNSVIELFLQILGSVLGALSSTLLPRNGIILCSKMTSSLKKLIVADCKKEGGGLIRTNLSNNAKIGKFLKTIPLYICTTYDIGLRGSLEYIRTHLEN